MTDPATIAKGLSEAQRMALHRVCATNGGGVPVRCRADPDTGEVLPVNGAMRRLFQKGLIQGKAGAYETVVHTRKGLAVRRALQEQEHG